MKAHLILTSRGRRKLQCLRGGVIECGREASRPARELSRSAVKVILALYLCFGWAAECPGQSGVEQITADPVRDGRSFKITEFILEYEQEHPQLPPLAEVLQLEVELVQAADGYIGAREGLPAVMLQSGGGRLSAAPERAPTVKFKLAEAPRLPIQVFYSSAINQICQSLVNYFHGQDIFGVYVRPHEEDFFEERDAAGKVIAVQDIRGPERTALRLVIWVGVVREARTIASGRRFGLEERINHPAHERIISHSPVRPWAEGAGERHDLFRKSRLDEYIFFLNRHPGRDVEVALVSAQERGGLGVDYMINENRPWLSYFQVSNTGTERTDKWRERFGFINTQLLGNDDILSLDYITSGFNQVHAALGSYEAPWGENDRLRWRAGGLWSEVHASQYGFTGREFISEQREVNGAIIANIYQHNDLFLDAYLGMRWQHIGIDDEVSLTDEADDFFLPRVGLEFEKITGLSTSYGGLHLEWNNSGWSGTDEDKMEQLGRMDVDDDWWVFQYSASHNFYLEPVLNRQEWEDVTTPESSTLAHELAFSLRGQYAGGNRLLAQFRDILGGLYSVRGYPENVAAGDNSVLASAEYRYHIPRAFKIEPDPTKTRFFGRPFKFAPQRIYHRPDWDLVLRTFFDVGRVTNNDRPSFEFNETLMSWGVGLEVQLTRLLSVRCDWGYALESLEGTNVNAGTNRFHLIGTLAF